MSRGTRAAGGGPESMLREVTTWTLSGHWFSTRSSGNSVRSTAMERTTNAPDFDSGTTPATSPR